MSKETLEIIRGVAVLVPFLVLVFIAFRVLAAWTNARFRRALLPLAPFISGTLHSNGIHGSMTGTFRGRDVEVQATTGTRSLEFPGHSDQKRNLFTIEITGLTGEQEWGFSHGREVVFGKNHWRLHADDDALLERLDHTGVITRIEAMENLPVIRFSAARKTLSYIEDILPNLAPLPERFQKQLEQLAQINEQVNSAPSPSLT